jgi:hypothetical protein
MFFKALVLNTANKALQSVNGALAVETETG